MWFASYLYEKGVITGQQFAEAAKIQLQRRKKFGTIAMNLGKLSIKQLMEILSIQADNLDAPIGEIAIQLGFLTRSDVAEILAVQSTDVPDFGQILVEMCIITEEQMADELRKVHDSSLSLLETNAATILSAT